MKYIKPFNENTHIQSKEEYIEEVRDFFEEHLTDMLDMGYRVDIFDQWHSEKNHDLIVILRMSRKQISWRSIKDYFIPFFDILLDNYNIKMQFNLTHKGHVIMDAFYDKSDILHDNIPINALTNYIKILVSKKDAI